MSKHSIADIARKWRAKYPKLPHLKLARLIMKSKDGLNFKSVETARSSLRYIAGKNGEWLRHKSVVKSEFFELEPRPLNPYKLPESDETSFEPYHIRGHKRVAVFSDIHAPFHSIPALTAAIAYVKKEKPDALLLNGDSIDCHKLSKFAHDAGKRDFAGELEIFRQLIWSLAKTLKCKIYFKVGNHEERYDKYLAEKAGELQGVEEFVLEQIIRARAEGIGYIADKRIMRLGGLNVIHGHEFTTGFFNPVNVARGLYLRGKTSAMQGHSHQTSEHTEADMNGKITTTWSVGCLCELHPNYAPLNKWNHGFAIIDIDGQNFEVRNKRIYKGVVL